MKPPDAKRDPVFEASAKCPAYVVPDEVADAVREKQQADDAEFAKLVAKGTPVAQINTGIDGGMHKVFAAKLPGGSTGLSEGGSGLALLTLDKAPGTIPASVNPPRGPVTSPEQPLAASLTPASSTTTTATSSSSTRVAAAAPAAQSTESEGFFSSLARKVGLGGASADATATATQQPAPARSKTADAKPPHPDTSTPKASKESSKNETKQASTRPPLKPAVTDAAASAPAAAAFAAPAASQNSLVAGAQPIVPANSFDSRFSAAK